MSERLSDGQETWPFKGIAWYCWSELRTASRSESMILNGLQSTSDWDSSDVTLPNGAGVRRMAQKVLDMPRLSSDNVPPGDTLKRKAKAPEAAPKRYS